MNYAQWAGTHHKWLGIQSILNKTILEVIVGSTVHGCNVGDGLDDTDIMSVVIEPKASVLGFNVKDTWTHRSKPQGVRSEAGDVDSVAYGLRKFLSLSLKGNPSILLAFFVPIKFTNIHTYEGIELRDLRSLIISKNVYKPYSGYMESQHQRLLGLRGQKNVTRPELVDAYGFDTKYVAHILRLGFQGEELLLTGKITLPMSLSQRKIVVDCRRGKFSLIEVSEMIVDVKNRLKTAYVYSPLPEAPDKVAVESWMIKTYLKTWSGSNQRCRMNSIYF